MPAHREDASRGGPRGPRAGGCLRRAALETSCYGCLRSYANQLFHDSLSRGEAQALLKALETGLER